MKNIEYDNKVLNLIENLSFINQSILITKDQGKIRILSSKDDESIAYTFEAPETSFNFDGEECAFYNYSEFHKLFSVLDQPNIKQDDVNLILVKNKQKINYRITDPEIIQQEFDGVDFDEPNVKFKLTNEFIRKIKSMGSAGMLDAKRLNLNISGDELTLKLWDKKHENTYEDVLNLEEHDDFEFSFDIHTSVFNHLPEGNYQVSIKQEGIVEFKLLSEITGVELLIYTGEVED